MTKKALVYILIFFFIIALGGGLLYYFLVIRPDQSEIIVLPDDILKKPGKTTFPGDGSRPGGNTPGTSTTTATSTRPGTELDQEAPRYRRISDKPVAGAVVFNNIVKNKKVGASIIRFIEKSTGNIYETTATSSLLTLLTTAQVPEGIIHEAFWSKKGGGLYIRYANGQNIETIYGQLAQQKPVPSDSGVNTATYKIRSSFLSKNIDNIVPSPGETGRVTLSLVSDRFNLYNSRADGIERTLIYTTPIWEWSLAWPKESTVTITSKPSGLTPGYMYFINSQTGAESRVLGDIYGLTTLTNPTADKVLVSGVFESGFKTFWYDIKTGQYNALDYNTFSEKCIWSNTNQDVLYCAIPNYIPSDNVLPDDWYQGTISFEDSIWKFDLKKKTSELLVNAKREGGVDVDATNLYIDNLDSYITFIDKKEGYLWGIRLK